MDKNSVGGKRESSGFQHNLLFPEAFAMQFSLLMTLKKKAVDIFVAKEKMLVTSIFSFLTMFSALLKRNSIFDSHLVCDFSNASKLNQSILKSFGKRFMFSKLFSLNVFSSQDCSVQNQPYTR